MRRGALSDVRARLAGRVGDGICDCCDGSDEPRGVCGNVCDRELAERVAAARAELAVYADGLAARAAVAAKGATKLGQWRAQVDGASEASAAAEAWRVEADRRVKLLEAREASGDVDDAEVEAQAEMKAPGADGAASDDADAPREETEVERAKRIAMQWGAATGEEEEASGAECGEGSNDPMTCNAGVVDDWDEEVAGAVAPLLRDPAAEKPPEWSDEDDGPWETPTKENPRFSEMLTKAKRDLDKAAAKVSKVKREREQAERLLKGSYGEGGELAAFADECIKSKVGEYEYELCAFEKAMQIESEHYSRRTDLGRWEGFGGEGVASMHFSNGAACPNGVKRKMDAKLVCGASSAVLSVEEPSMCEYEARVSTPLACSEKRRAELEAFIAEKGEA